MEKLYSGAATRTPAAKAIVGLQDHRNTSPTADGLFPALSCTPIAAGVNRASARAVTRCRGVGMAVSLYETGVRRKWCGETLTSSGRRILSS